MSAHTKTRHISTRSRHRASIIYFKHKNKRYAIPKKIAEQYVITSPATSVEKTTQPVLAEDIFAEIENRFTKAGVLLKGLRNREGLTQAQFAKKIQVTQSNLSHMEHGRRTIGKEIAKRIEKVFHVNYRYFLG